MTRVLTAKLTPPQKEAWDKLRSAVGFCPETLTSCAS